MSKQKIGYKLFLFEKIHYKLQYGDGNMEHYKILGVDENATMEEIKEAYDNKVKQFKEEIKDERRAKKFIEVFDKAYDYRF